MRVGTVKHLPALVGMMLLASGCGGGREVEWDEGSPPPPRSTSQPPMSVLLQNARTAIAERRYGDARRILKTATGEHPAFTNRIDILRAHVEIECARNPKTTEKDKMVALEAAEAICDKEGFDRSPQGLFACGKLWLTKAGNVPEPKDDASEEEREAGDRLREEHIDKACRAFKDAQELFGSKSEAQVAMNAYHFAMGAKAMGAGKVQAAWTHWRKMTGEGAQGQLTITDIRDRVPKWGRRRDPLFGEIAGDSR